MSNASKNKSLRPQRATYDRYSDDEAADYPSPRAQNQQRQAMFESRMEDSERADYYYYGLNDEYCSDRE